MKIKKITSQENYIYKSFARLYKKKYRDRTGLYVIEGVNLIKEAALNGAVLRSVFIREDFERQFLIELSDQISSFTDMGIYELSRQLFDSAVDTETPQGIAAVAEKPDFSPEGFLKSANNIIVLDRLQDPGNIGTILRTADAAGFGGAVIMKGTADVFSPKTVRAAAGSLNRIKLLYVDSPGEASGFLKVNGKKTVCTSPHEGVEYFNADLTDNIALIVGNEAGGACEEFLRYADINITLPMEGTIESLNAAVAASVIMYESVRQRRLK